VALNYVDLGDQAVKNIAQPVRVWRVRTEPSVAQLLTGAPRRVARKYVRGTIFSLSGLAIIVATILFMQHLSLRPPTTTASIPAPEKPSLPSPEIPSIAVLPFANLSGERDQDYFSDGLTDDLITALSRIPGLFVIARTSTFGYKGKAVMAQDVSRQLGVQYVLEGSVRKAGNQVRITAQLADATTGNQMWAEHFDRPLKDIFSLQDEIVRKLATTLQLELNLREKGFGGQGFWQRTDNLEAYDYMLRGLESIRNLTKDTNEEARQMYEKAIELDPKYSDAYAALGMTYSMDMINQWSRDPHGFERVPTGTKGDCARQLE